jgi:hypothetical protein
MELDSDVASILEQETQSTITAWLCRVNAEPDIITVRLNDEERSFHLRSLFRDLVSRLRNPLPLGTRALISDAADDHGCLRRVQGYTPAMLVEESRMLQVSIFQTLQDHLSKESMSTVLGDIMAIADEVDSQLAQAMSSYMFEATRDDEPVEA